MKRSSDKSRSRETANTVCGILFILLLFLGILTSDFWVEKTSLISSALYMPQGSLKVVGRLIKGAAASPNELKRESTAAEVFSSAVFYSAL